MLDLNKKFDESVIVPDIIQLLPKDFIKQDTEIKIDSSFKYFESILLLGKTKKLNNLNIYIIKTNNDGKNRVTLSRDIFKLLKQYVIENALVILHSNDGTYRLSYVKSVLNWEDNNRINRTFSNPKRFSYLLGPNAKVHTPYNKFFKKGVIDSVEDLEDRFDNEVISEEFFQNYKKLYSKLKSYIEDDKSHRGIIFKNNLNPELFATKIMGQILFTYFIQEKSWLGAGEKEKLYKGNKNYLRDSFGSLDNDKNYYNEFLEYLFYDGFNTKNKDDYVKSLSCKVPFLNGGLFAPLKGYEWKNEVLNIPNEFFSNSSKTGILDIFDLYNFTINETDPLDKEIGIDPEMLGKVFERLIDVNGVVYTPKIVVKNMCENVLIQYLINIKNEINLTEESITQLVKERYISDKSQLHKEVKKVFQKLDTKLKEIKIIDPAVGSGQFTTGMMSLICEIREKLNIFFEYDRKMFQLKKNCIQNSIYGVDIIDSSVEITKLRLWLSLIVDENRIENISSLPNLDYKIYQSDSLVISKVNIFNKDILEKFNSLKNNLYNENNIEKVNELKKSLNSTMDEILTTHDDIGIEIIFNEVFSKNNGGFDIVIGNPPYVSAVDSKRSKGLKNYYKKIYPEATGSYDDFVLFLLRALSILNKNGVYSWIIKNTFLSADYATKTKEKLILEGGLYQSLDISTEDVFHKIGVYPIIINGNLNNKNKNFQEYEVGNFNNLENENYTKVKKLKKYLTLSDFKIKLFTGMTGFAAHSITKILERKKTNDNIPFTVSGNVDRYIFNNIDVKYMNKSYERAYLNIKNQKVLAEQKINFFKSPKIVIAGMTKQIEAVYVKKPIALGVGIFGIYDFAGNDPYFLNFLFNSKFYSEYLVKRFKNKHLAGGYISINKSVIEKLPFMIVKNKDQQYISERSKYIHENIKDINDLEKPTFKKLLDEIDIKVENLFNA